MKIQHTAGKWLYKRQGFKITIGTENEANLKSGHNYTVAVIDDNSMQAEANARLLAAAPELLQMVYDLKQCVKRLTQDDVSQYDRDTEAQWIGEAHELLLKINL